MAALTGGEKTRLAERLKAVMRAQSLTQERLAYELSLDQPTISRFLRGAYATQNLSVERLIEYVNMQEEEEERQLDLPFEAGAALGRFVRRGGDPIALARIVDLVTEQITPAERRPGNPKGDEGTPI